MTTEDTESLEIARRWCVQKGEHWQLKGHLGRGGTAPVFSIVGPDGEYALKVYDERYSTGEKGEIESARVKRQVEIGRHDCPSLVQTYEGGRFEDRLYVLMGKAPGRELEKVLGEVPRERIRGILDQVARAAIFLREHKLCHRDIKTANVYVTDDFARATLLDLSVARDIYDPIGTGTDQDGQLPVVATTRYSPPEYLFRLLEPSAELWHALDIYQLGALLYDMIAREPLFQEEYQRSKENRYRFAWIISTVEPALHAPDVDADLLFLTRRSLDKDWARRSALQLEDFLMQDRAARKRAAFEVLGLSRSESRSSRRDVVALRSRLRSAASALEDHVLGYLQNLSVVAKHFDQSGDDDLSRELAFAWCPSSDSASADEDFQLQISVRAREAASIVCFECSMTLSVTVMGNRRSEAIALPSVVDSPDVISRLSELCIEAFGHLAEAVTTARPN